MSSKTISVDKLPDTATVFLDEVFRKDLIQKGIAKSGSLYELGRVMGYFGSTPTWNVKVILSGKQGIPIFRLKRLCKHLNMSLADVEKHVTRVKQ